MSVIPLRRKLVRSLDMIDLGASMRDAGSILTEVGTGIMQLHEPPTDLQLNQAADAASRMMQAVMVLRVAQAVVALPSDCERP